MGIVLDKTVQHGIGKKQNMMDFFSHIAEAGRKNMVDIRVNQDSPHEQRTCVTFKISEVEKITGVPRSTLRATELRSKKGNIDNPLVYPPLTGNISPETVFNAKGQKVLYTCEDIRAVLSHYKMGRFNGSVDRGARDSYVLSFMMFKGGVGKTTHSVHLAIYAAIHGLRVCYIDLDAQGSGTTLLGHVPELDSNETTLYDVLLEDLSLMPDIIKKTHFGNLDLVPGSMVSQNIDLDLQSAMHDAYTNREEFPEYFEQQQKLGTPLLRLKKAIGLISDQYDLIVIDCPPNHHASVLSAMIASEGIILPVSPSLLDYASSCYFSQQMSQLAKQLVIIENQYKSGEAEILDEDWELIKNFENRLFKVLITNDKNDPKEAQKIKRYIREMWQDKTMESIMAHTLILDRSANELGTIYDVKDGKDLQGNKLAGSREALTRARFNMDAVNEELLSLVIETWKEAA